MDRVTYGALVGSIGMIECVNIESVPWDLALKIFLLNNVVPEFARVLCTRHATCQAHNGSRIPDEVVPITGWI